jgi:hypothetical protein
MVSGWAGERAARAGYLPAATGPVGFTPFRSVVESLLSPLPTVMANCEMQELDALSCHKHSELGNARRPNRPPFDTRLHSADSVK